LGRRAGEKKNSCPGVKMNGEKEEVMELNSTSKGSKGGRPKKAVKRDQLLGVKRTLLERKFIEKKAEESALTVSEFLRELGLKVQGQIVKHKVIPKEVLLFTATLNHLAANLNQIAYRRNRGDNITLIERLEIMQLVIEIKALAASIKSYLK
jgi:hypothetical protein